MNKKGFTLIEVIISITLLSIVMTSMLASLVKLRDSYSKAYVNVDAVVFGSSIARFINNDLNKNSGIRYIECDNSGTKCDIYLANNQKRKIEILNTESGKFFNIGGEKVYCEIEPLKDKNGKYFKDINGDYVCEIEKLSTTVKYTDTSNNDSKLLFIKTISLDKSNKYNKVKEKENASFHKVEANDLEKVSTTGYIFGKLSAKCDGFAKPNNPTIRNVITSINIPIYDGIDRNDATYNIQIYTDASYSTKLLVGEDILIRLNNNSDIYDLGNIKEISHDFVEKYGIGFYKHDNGKKEEIQSITIPVAENNYKFEGYYYNDVKIIDEAGKILVNSDYFIDECTLNAKWIEN